MDDRAGDLGLGTAVGWGDRGSYITNGSQRRVAGGEDAAGMTRSANLGVHLRGHSAAVGRSPRQQGPYDANSSMDGAALTRYYDGGSGGGSDTPAKAEYFRNQSTTAITTVIAPSTNIGEHIREAVQEWQKKSGLVNQKLEENRQQLKESIQEVKSRECPHCAQSSVHHAAGCRHCQHLTTAAAATASATAATRHAPPYSNATGQHDTGGFGYSTVKESSQHESHYEEDRKTSNMALVKSSASGSGANSALMTTSGSGGSDTPIVQCYTVTKQTTTTTYGDEEGDEETSVVTTTEKKWQEGMNEVGEISVAAAATVGELLPSIGAPAHVLNDVSNVRSVRSMTNVEGGVSNVVRRYEFQQTMNDAETLF